MEKFFLNTLLASCFILTACSGAEISNVDAIDSNVSVSGNFSTYSTSKIEGSGTIRFSQVLSSSRSLALKGSLDSTIALSSISAVFYSSNLLLPTNDGIAVTFRRSGVNVIAQVSINGNTASVKTSQLAFYYPTSLDLIIDVHNEGSKSRVLVWRRNAVEYAAMNADFDTNNSSDFDSSLPYQTGGGGFTGLILQNATVTSATLGAQKIP